MTMKKGSEVFFITNFRIRILRKHYYIFVTILVISALCAVKLFIDHRRYMAELLQDIKCWTDHLGVPKNFQNEKKLSLKPLPHQREFIPETVEEAPTGFAPSIPKQFIIEQKNYCKDRPRLRAIAYVHSAINRVYKRNFTRYSWGSFSDNIGVVFMVGKPKNKTEEDIVNHESRLYHDIVQGNYTDMYQLLTYKGLNSLYWISKNCQHVPWVIHADDDVLFDINRLLQVLDEFEYSRRVGEIFCYTFRLAKVNRDAKWAVNYKEYPCRMFPPYCSGPAWFTSMGVIHSLLAYVPRSKYLWIDDTYVTGLLAEMASVKRTDIDMVSNNFNIRHLGSTIAWLHVLTNRTANWLSILSYYGDPS